MPSNVEIKARVQDLDKLRDVARLLSQSEGCVLQQEDTFYKVPCGRLKLRQLMGEAQSRLIFYKREDTTGPKRSDYSITVIDNTEDLKVTLGQALGIVGQVKKTRWLYLVGQTRVHVDRVQGLGDFMELEVVLRDDQSTEEGQKIAESLMAQLNVTPEDLLDGAYMDLLIKQEPNLLST